LVAEYNKDLDSDSSDDEDDEDGDKEDADQDTESNGSGDTVPFDTTARVRVRALNEWLLAIGALVPMATE
jgi:hypothetical protein